MFYLIMLNKQVNTYMNKYMYVGAGMVESYNEVSFAVPIWFSKFHLYWKRNSFWPCCFLEATLD